MDLLKPNQVMHTQGYKVHDATDSEESCRYTASRQNKAGVRGSGRSNPKIAKPITWQPSSSSDSILLFQDQPKS